MADVIPTSNKPAATALATKSEEKKDIVSTPEFQKKVKDTINEVKGLLDITNNEMVKVEGIKLDNVYKIGQQMNKLIGELGPKERVVVVKQFHREAGMDESWFYRAISASNLFTKEDLAKLKKNNVTVQALYAVLSVKDPVLQKKMIAQALATGITADEIRTTTGKKGLRREAYAKKARENNKKKPPMRVFTQGLERLHMVDESIGSCSDAVGRLAECKTEEERKEAIKVLIEIRKKAPDVVDQLTSFMKFTANFSKK